MRLFLKSPKYRFPNNLTTKNVSLAPIKESYFFSPVLAMMVCVESILAELVIQLDDKALTRLNRAETFLGAMEMEL